MSVRRIMGSESEYGLTSPGLTDQSHSYLSALLVSAFADAEQSRAIAEGRPGFLPRGGWDYASERPLQDARGFAMSRAAAHPSQLTDAEARIEAPELDAVSVALGRDESFTDGHSNAPGGSQGIPLTERTRDALVTNIMLVNGARFYVDHAHPEYSSPEVLSPRDMVAWDLAGDEIAMAAATEVKDVAGPEIRLFKNNADVRGSSYGTHENYAVDRSVPFEDLVEALLPFFVTRPLLCGAGRVGPVLSGLHPGLSRFHISARADFFEQVVGLETTLRRPIVNARDEPHADHTRLRRLHVIVGDGNLVPGSIYLRFATTSLVLGLIERGMAPRLELADPVAAFQSLSQDLPLEEDFADTDALLRASYRTELPLADGSVLSPMKIQRMYLDAAQRAFLGADEETDEALALWADTLDKLEHDPLSLAPRVEWIAKLRLLDAYRGRGSLAWSDVALQALDLQFSQLDPAKGLGLRQRAAGVFEEFASEAQVRDAVRQAPPDTRASIRGWAVERCADRIRSITWDRITFMDGFGSPPQILALPDPTRTLPLGFAEAVPETDRTLHSTLIRAVGMENDGRAGRRESPAPAADTTRRQS